MLESMHKHDRRAAGGFPIVAALTSVIAGALSAQPPSKPIALPVSHSETRTSTKRVPMRDVALMAIGRPDSRMMSASVTAAIGTPFGRVPIRGNIRLNVDCDGAFRGTISYSAVVRFFAKVKGVDLITNLDGQVERTDSATCLELPTDTVRGTAVVEKELLRGALRQRGDSTHFVGPAWMMGDSSYHSVVRVTRATQSLDIRVNMYERSGKHP